jgi:bifunctional DNase/RNase
MEMFLGGITIDNQSPILVLTDADKRRALPIRIGPIEMDAICTAYLDQKPDRPQSHDLTLNIIEGLGWKVSCAEVTDVTNNTLYAALHLVPDETGRQLNEVLFDARPSDAVAVALRAKAPIYISPQVMDEAAVPLNQLQDEAESEEFHNFVEKLKPSDFGNQFFEEGKG